MAMKTIAGLRRLSVLPVIAEEVFHFFHGFSQHLDPWQIDDAEVIGLRPVESAAGDEEDLLFAEQVKGELLVVGDVELLRIHLREDVESRFWLHGADAGDIGERFVNVVTLFAHPSARRDIAAHALVSAECSLHDGLGRHVGAEAHVGEHLQSFDVVFCHTLVAA